MYEETIKSILLESMKVKENILENKELLSIISKVAQEIINAFKMDKKVLLCGNGGSAADAQHIAAELSGKFYIDREPLFAEALHVNTSYLTAVANDYSYDEVFSRLVKAKGRPGDILIGISTSGNSKNVIKAIESANEIGMITVGMTGKGGGKMKGICKYLIAVPSQDTPRIQEAHITIGHIICEIVERELFKNG
ncbi:MAG: SIS domain-containing protein [Caldimicrobium sp.]|jgi:D-sedoheptulose 7-phosphate isomerase|nr:SIS domain-containing protein [Caldimicrobium sp.]